MDIPNEPLDGPGGEALQDFNQVIDLFLAAGQGDADQVRALVQRGLQVNVQLRARRGLAPLHFAAMMGHGEVASELIAAGANVDLQTVDGETALHLAAKSGQNDMVKKLIRSQADINLTTTQGETPIFSAILGNHCHVVESLIQAQAGVDVQQIEGATPLYMGVQDAHLDIVRALVRAQADADCQTDAGAGPLHVAAEEGNSDIVAELIKSGVAVDAQTGDNLSALFICVMFRNLDATRLLVEAKADVNMQQSDGASSLYLACQNGMIEAADCLIGAHADVDLATLQGVSPLYAAVQNGRSDDFARLLLQAQCDVDVRRDEGDALLYMASQEGQYQLVETLLRARANADLQDASGMAPLHAAAQNGHHRAARLLIEAQANVNLRQDCGATPLYIAAENGHLKVVELLVRNLAEVDSQSSISGSSPLHIAAQNGHCQVVRALASAKADLDLRNQLGCTPIYLAAQNGHHQVVSALIESRANVNLQQATGLTPLYAAVQNGHARNVELLLAASADLNLKDDVGNSPLIAASVFDSVQCLEALIRTNADVDIRNDIGCSPVYLAANNGQLAVVQALIRAQADVDSIEKSGRSPLYAAASSGHVEVIQELLKAGADTGIADSAGLTPATVASLFGHRRAAELLLQAGTERGAEASATHRSVGENALQNLTDTAKQRLTEVESMLGGKARDLKYDNDFDLSLQLQASLVQAGFQRSRARLQSAAADVLQSMLRSLHDGQYFFIVGSFSEGWGNSLVRLNGRTDQDSDIDVTCFYGGNPFHLRGRCQCENTKPEDLVDYRNGHVEAPGFATTPSLPIGGSSLKAALDRVNVYRCCCYPCVELLEQRTNEETNISPPVMALLREQLSATTCHLATAGPPEDEGRYLRVSTTFLEKQLMRCLSEVQGQLFIILKYIIKKVVSPKVSGLKTYHAKNLVFYMLDETPPQDWQASRLVELTRRALQRLVSSMQATGPDSTECMRHFFLRDAIVYFKKAALGGKHRIVQSVLGAIDSLPRLLTQFMRGLKPLSDARLFYLHPFLALPDIRAVMPTRLSSPLKYHEIYPLVAELVAQLSEEQSTMESLATAIDRVPDCALTARECLRAMACLKFGRLADAEVALRRSIGQPVCRGLTCCPADGQEATVAEDVWQHLKETNSAWKFYFRCSRRPEFSFLPETVREAFPVEFGGYSDYFFINFDALQRCLQLELFGGGVGPDMSAWFKAVVLSDDTDVQELRTVLWHCQDADVLAQLFQLQASSVDEYFDSLGLTELMALRPNLMTAAMELSMESANAAFKLWQQQQQ